MTEDYSIQTPEQKSLIGKLLRFCMTNRLVVFLLVLFIMAAGFYYAPFDWVVGNLPRDPVATDAIPDIGENQQIVFTEWMGRSPQDVEDQVSYPLTVALLGLPEVKTVRSYSFFGFSSIYIIFKEKAEFYWSRSRVLEKLNSLPAGTLPEGVQPALGPDSTALGQIYWYTLEGRDPEGKPAGGWDLEELRTIQDWYVRYTLQSADGVSEVASVGGFAREYQIDVNPDAMRAYKVTLPEVFAAVKGSNLDVGARSVELNKTEYFVRGVGFIKSVKDIENSVIKVNDDVPVSIAQVATVTLGPALRRGALDKEGAEAVGGVVVARYGANPLAVIKNVKKKIQELAPGLKTKVIVDANKVSPDQVRAFARAHGFEAYSGGEMNQEAWLAYLQSTPRDARLNWALAGWLPFPRDALPGRWPDWVTTSQVTVVPFYDRTGLIYETLGTLNDALMQEIMVTLLVVIVMMVHLRSSALIGAMLPLAVLMCFVAMKLFGVDANIVALSGIAIAIGTIVDMGIVICENILRHLGEAPSDAPRLEVVHRAASEVGSAVLTAVATTVVGFLPVFTMIGAEGKLFRPLAFTKTFALISSIVIALTVLPPFALMFFCGGIGRKLFRWVLYGGLATAGAVLGAYGAATGSLPIALGGAALVLLAAFGLLRDRLPGWLVRLAPWLANAAAVLLIGLLLTQDWEPLGPQPGLMRNFIFVAVLVGGLLGFFHLFRLAYPYVLRWALDHKVVFLGVICAMIFFGYTVWLGMDTTMGWIPAAAEKVGVPQETTRSMTFWVNAKEKLPGVGKEFMPSLDEGSFLYMPTTMVHASIGEAMDVLSQQDQALTAIPEIESAVGKIGRVESPLDPAPISMVETIINYKSEYRTDKDGRRINFREAREGESVVLDVSGTAFAADETGEPIPDPAGRPFRQWRSGIRTPDDIWKEIVKAAQIPGSTSAPKLQPIAARIVMLQSGMRAPMGVKIKGPDLATIEKVGLQVEQYLKQVPSIEPAAVIADRIVGKPYLEIVPDRSALNRYGVKIKDFQDAVEVAIGGKKVTTTVEGRERFGVRVRYQRELRDQIETMGRILVAGKGGVQVPISQLAEIRYVRGPQVIKSEDTFKTGYVLFDMKEGQAEVDVVEQAQAYLRSKIDSGEFSLPPGVSYSFAGSYENQIRAQTTLMIVLPLSLFVIFLLLYFQFRSVATTLLVFIGIFVAWSGGFILIWLYGQDWFLNFTVFGVHMRTLFQVHPINLSVAVWVGFLALFGIASDDGVVISTYLDQVFRARRTTNKSELRAATVEAGKRRVRPCLMTTATTILALIPVLTSTGRGSDVMVPMAIPSFGGMVIEVLTMLTVPVLYCLVKEIKLRLDMKDELLAAGAEPAPGA
ncbi:MAG: Cation efflux system protein CusA [Planctomycetes bacterium ADurb.Bin126]|nr:MAG: Cation efflux system protein CusA [Planctomycetes bacterium ADurb.Bin126]HOD82979.1 efflux RND transporter permease subunit [Phycisphaerae bacterium]HQL75128.1 efflux RND transporter permease subunit [Phycisphaerae bacterium]